MLIKLLLSKHTYIQTYIHYTIHTLYMLYTIHTIHTLYTIIYIYTRNLFQLHKEFF